MVGINPMVASHKLNVLPTAKPIRQKVRRFHLNRHQIIQTEVDNLLAADFIREVNCFEWLANVVVVHKKGGKWRVCIGKSKELPDHARHLQETFELLRRHNMKLNPLKCVRCQLKQIPSFMVT